MPATLIFKCSKFTQIVIWWLQRACFDHTCFHKSSCKKRPTDDFRCHVLPLTENNFCIVVFNFSIFFLPNLQDQIFWERDRNCSAEATEASCSILLLLNTQLHNDQLLQKPSIFIFLFASSGELDKEDWTEHTKALYFHQGSQSGVATSWKEQNENGKYFTSGYRGGSSYINTCRKTGHPAPPCPLEMLNTVGHWRGITDTGIFLKNSIYNFLSY